MPPIGHHQNHLGSYLVDGIVWHEWQNGGFAYLNNRVENEGFQLSHCQVREEVEDHHDDIRHVSKAPSVNEGESAFSQVGNPGADNDQLCQIWCSRCRRWLEHCQHCSSLENSAGWSISAAFKNVKDAGWSIGDRQWQWYTCSTWLPYKLQL